MVDAHAVLSLPVLAGVGACQALEDRKKSRKRQVYDLDIIVLSLLKHPTAKEIICQFIKYMTCFVVWYIPPILFTMLYLIL